MGELVARSRLREMPSDFLDSDEYNKAELLRHYRTSIVRQQTRHGLFLLVGPALRCFAIAMHFKGSSRSSCGGNSTGDLSSLAKTEFVFWQRPTRSQDRYAHLAKGWAAHTFLARVAPSVCYRGKLSTVLNRSDMKPLIASQPFVEALDQLSCFPARDLWSLTQSPFTDS